jgi:hypothetical protein
MKPAMNGQYGTTTSPRARIVERGLGQPAAQVQALVGLVDLGVDEGDPPAAQAMLSQPERSLQDRWIVRPTKRCCIEASTELF